MLKLDVSAAAEDDASEVLAYYDAISPELRQSFQENLSSALSLLCTLPAIGSRRFAHLFPGIDLRTWSINQFPFRIFYAVEGEYLRVFRIGHERRNVTAKLIDGGKVKK